jgi:hypothetical protein
MHINNPGLTEVMCLDGNYLVNERLVRQIIKSYYRAKANLDNAGGVELDTAWYEPGIIMYEVKNLGHVRSWTEQQTDNELYSNWLVSLPNMQPRIAALSRMHQETEQLVQKFKANVREYYRRNFLARERMVSLWSGAAASAKFTRDAAAGTLMVGATVLTGGSSAALFAGGSGTVLRCGAKLQDARGSWKDNIGASARSRTWRGPVARAVTRV